MFVSLSAWTNSENEEKALAFFHDSGILAPLRGRVLSLSLWERCCLKLVEIVCGSHAHSARSSSTSVPVRRTRSRRRTLFALHSI